MTQNITNGLYKGFEDEGIFIVLSRESELLQIREAYSACPFVCPIARSLSSTIERIFKGYVISHFAVITLPQNIPSRLITGTTDSLVPVFKVRILFPSFYSFAIKSFFFVGRFQKRISPVWYAPAAIAYLYVCN